MTAPRLAQAHKIVDDVRAALDSAGLQKVTCTLDAGLIPSGAREGIVVVSAPKLTFGAPFTEAEFGLHVVAEPADDYLAAWERLDLIIEALVDGGINLRDGQPGGFAAGGIRIPGYDLTLNDPE